MAIALWLLNFLLTIYVWKKSIKPILGAVTQPQDHENEGQEESMGPQSWDQATKSVYSTQL